MSDKKRKVKSNLQTHKPEVHKELSRKGGIKSGESRRKNKAFRDALSQILAAPVTKDRSQKLAELTGAPKNTQFSYMEAIVISMVDKAIDKQDKSAADWIRDTFEGPPKQTHEVSAGSVDREEVERYAAEYASQRALIKSTAADVLSSSAEEAVFEDIG